MGSLVYSSSILVAVLLYGWFTNDGDVAYGRLTAFPEPEGGVNWLHVLAPATLLVLTRFGVPVSTTFLILSVFVPRNIEAMLVKSLSGYFVAFIVAILLYWAIRRLTNYLSNNLNSREATATHWVVLQWTSTAFLWSQWLIQDLANIYVFAPRQVDLSWLLGSILFLLMMQGFIYYHRGGHIQQIVTRKTMTGDVRSATIVDFVYGLILLVFKEWSHMPMSTTWVFLGLLAGREIAMTMQLGNRPLKDALKLIGTDAFKAFTGLVISVALALAGTYYAR